LAKSITIQRQVYKIEGNRFKRNNWSLILDNEKAFKNREIVSLGESETLRFIEEILGKDTKGNTEKYFSNKQKLRELRRNKLLSIKQKKQIKDILKENKEIIFIPEYLSVKFKTKKDFRTANKKLFLNGKKYVRLLGTNGGIKKNTIVYVDESIHQALETKINNNVDPNIELVPAKMEAYRGLSCSASTRVSMPKGIVVVKDFVTSFKADVTYIEDVIKEEPTISTVKDYVVDLEDSDGNGIILPSLSKKWTKELTNKDYISSGFCIRGSYMKGMLGTFDFIDFAINIAKTTKLIDIWGKEWDIIDDEIEVIIPTSVFKLHEGYSSFEEYLNSCKENNFNFSVTKMIDNNPDNERSMNYQFLQSLKLKDKDIYKLIQPTIDEFHDILGLSYEKSLLFLNGEGMNKKNTNIDNKDYMTALKIEPKLIDDPFIRKRIYSMIKKKINDAKIGAIKTEGNYSTIFGDLYGFAESSFSMDNPKGLLKAGEFYSNYWNERNVTQVAAMRAPMTVDSNLRKFNLVSNDKVKYWYKYLTNCTIFNAWDVTCNALNGADKDGDTVYTTNNKYIIKGIKDLLPIICAQKPNNKVRITPIKLAKSNSDAFNDKIGEITNYGSSITQLLFKFKANSKEYKELYKRVQYTMKAQQDEIDSAKGIVSKGMPKEWFSYKMNKIKEDDTKEEIKKKKFNLKILADKKPYFFIYVYPTLKRKYKDYENMSNRQCGFRFKKNINELIKTKNKTEDEKIFYKYYLARKITDENNSLMNKICWKFETEFDNFLTSKIKNVKFDYTILKTNEKYSKKRYNNVKSIYKEYKRELIEYVKKEKNSINKDSSQKYYDRIIFINRFKDKCIRVCPNENELCDIVVDISYSKGYNTSKQFCWDMCSEIIIDNLYCKNKSIKYVEKDIDGDIEFKGRKFKLKEKIIKEKI